MMTRRIRKKDGDAREKKMGKDKKKDKQKKTMKKNCSNNAFPFFFLRWIKHFN